MFYQGQTGTAATFSPTMSKDIMQLGPKLSQVQKVKLCKVITDREILTGLKAIGNEKSLGINGFNVTFFKYSRSIIKEDIITVVQEFFRFCKLPS